MYDYAIQQDTSNLIPSVAAFYQEALTEAKAVLDDPAATQLEVDAACGKLMRAVHHAQLGPRRPRPCWSCSSSGPTRWWSTPTCT